MPHVTGRLSQRELPDLQSWSSVGTPSSHRFPYREAFEAFGQSPVGIAICDKHLRFVRVNRRLAEMNNIPPNDHPGKFVCDIVGSLGSTVSARLTGVFRTGLSLHNAELFGQLGAARQSGRYVENMFPIYDGHHKIKHVGVFVLAVSKLGLHESLSFQFSGTAASFGGLDPDKRPLCRQALSPRETDILCLLASGKSTKEAAAGLGISFHTAYMFRSRLMLKLQAHSLTDLVHFAIRHGFVTLQGSTNRARSTAHDGIIQGS